MYIAIDTSTDIASLAIVRDKEILAELSWHCRQNHSVQLLPNLEHLLKQTGLDMKSAEGIIVARGPGTYNGLRVGVGTAKGLAFSLNIPIVGVSTLEVVAYQHAETGLPVCPVFSAGREEIGTATYRKNRNGHWRQLAAEHLTTVEPLCTGIKVKTLFCGEYMPVIAGKLKELLQEKAVFVSPAGDFRRAGYLAELGIKRIKEGDVDDVASLQPFYFRSPPIGQPKANNKAQMSKSKIQTKSK
jgi:tRNA threonylcarbamoyladenosine biosynthesis protein TsaB